MHQRGWNDWQRRRRPIGVPSNKLKLELQLAAATVSRMNLEDHLGDVIGKSRAMTKVSATDAAKAAGLSEVELLALEDSGQPSKRPNYAALAGLIDLDAGKLERLAAGWLPGKKDLSQWRELRMFTTSQDVEILW